MTHIEQQRVRDGEAGFSLIEALASVVVLAVAWMVVTGLLEVGAVSAEREQLASAARSAGGILREMARAGALTGERGVFTVDSIEWQWHIEHRPLTEGVGWSDSPTLYVQHKENASALASYRAQVPVRR